MTSGIGYAQMKQILAAMDIPRMSEGIYSKYQEDMIGLLQECAKESMKKAGEEELQMAFKRGDVKFGRGMTKMIADGSWLQRSYRTGKFDSNALVGIIVGYYTQKVLYMDVKNRFCLRCRRQEGH